MPVVVVELFPALQQRGRAYSCQSVTVERRRRFGTTLVLATVLSWPGDFGVEL